MFPTGTHEKVSRVQSKPWAISRKSHEDPRKTTAAYSRHAMEVPREPAVQEGITAGTRDDPREPAVKRGLSRERAAIEIIPTATRGNARKLMVKRGFPRETAVTRENPRVQKRFPREPAGIHGEP